MRQELHLTGEIPHAKFQSINETMEAATRSNSIGLSIDARRRASCNRQIQATEFQMCQRSQKISIRTPADFAQLRNKVQLIDETMEAATSSNSSERSIDSPNKLASSSDRQIQATQFPSQNTFPKHVRSLENRRTFVFTRRSLRQRERVGWREEKEGQLAIEGVSRICGQVRYLLFPRFNRRYLLHGDFRTTVYDTEKDERQIAVWRQVGQIDLLERLERIVKLIKKIRCKVVWKVSYNSSLSRVPIYPCLRRACAGQRKVSFNSSLKIPISMRTLFSAGTCNDRSN